MSNIKDTPVNAGPAPTQTSSPQKAGIRSFVGKGLLAAVAAMAATTTVAALAKTAGLDFEIPEGGETIPLSGIAFVTGVFSVVGVVIAAALLRWSTHPSKRWVQVAVSLTATSLVPPFLPGASTATAFALASLHLVAAAVMIPTLTRSIVTTPRSGSDRAVPQLSSDGGAA